MLAVPDWQQLAFSEGILPEPIPDNRRIVLWLVPDRERGSCSWERIASVAGAKVTGEQNICAYRVIEGIALFSVADVGRGVLASLRSNRKCPAGRIFEIVMARQTDPPRPFMEVF